MRVKLKSSPYDYRRCLPHKQFDRPLFVGFNTINRWTLPNEARDITLNTCLFENAKPIDLHAAVVMPEHVHLLFDIIHSKETDPPSLHRIVGDIKSISAHKINKLLKRSGRVWLDESFDHALRANTFEECIQYIRQNPVKRGLVATPEDYPWLWVR
jgi:REP element-mobilizing transposase RayT